MAKVAKAVPPPTTLPSDSLNFCGGAAMKPRPVVKRKTPSELRGEQLKRRIAVEVVNESSAPSENTEAMDSGIRKAEVPRNPRYTDKRLDQVFPAVKPNSRLSLLSVKSKLKQNQVLEEKSGIKSSFSSHFTLKSHKEQNDKLSSGADSNAFVSQKRQTSEKDSQNRFRSVEELSSGRDSSAQIGTVDIAKALKGLARETSGSCSPPSHAGKTGDLKSSSFGQFSSELHVSGGKVPLDLTLKTSMRIVSSSPVDRFHRLLMGGTYGGMTPLSLPFGHSGGQSLSGASISPTSGDFCSLNSWIYPQSLLPASVMSLLSASRGGAETDFLNKRQLAWEDSFRSLYYTLRKSGCDLFYVCTLQFVVMFTAVGGLGNSKRMCKAYISQSTRGLRSLLREHDICFTMPYCSEEVEISREDLVELSEIEKNNLGQAKRMGSMPNFDNSPRSLLAFSGNDSVHGLYDFILNYRSWLNMLTSLDVPVLCAPIPFLNAALSSPEVKCKEIKLADILLSKGLATKGGQSIDSSTGFSYIIEIKDVYLPPWTICSICSTMASEGQSFEASLISEPNSSGLNAAFEAVTQNINHDETSADSQDNNCTYGISAAVIMPDLQSASVKSLKYTNGAYLATLSPM